MPLEFTLLVVILVPLFVLYAVSVRAEARRERRRLLSSPSPGSGVDSHRSE